jgi:iron complex transport system ATP-binding protein
VDEFVRMGRYARESFFGAPGEGDGDAVRGALADVGMSEFALRSVRELSGGEFRRVLIAQALAQETPVLLLDEPVQQLDLLHQIEVMELVRRLAHRAGSAAVAVLHDLGLAARYCDEIVLLARGGVAAAGRPEDVITEANVRDVYGVEAVVDRCAATGAVRVVPVRPTPREARNGRTS